LYYENNIGSTIVLGRVMRKYGVKKIIFSSSATVYSQDNKMPLSENAKTGDCTNPYGWTKFGCEQILKDMTSMDAEWSVVLLRYFNPIGAHPSGLIGEHPKGIPNNLMPYIAQTAAGIREKLYVFGDDYNTVDGTGVRDYIHVVDLAQGHVKAVDWALDNKGCEAFNLGTGNGTSVLELRDAFVKSSGIDVPYVIDPRRPGDPDEVYANAEKAKNILGWEAKFGIEEMCEDTWRWQSNNPKGYEK
jgi:UDP-glucose 4-epimerase